MASFLFIYGTLLLPNNEFGNYLKTNSAVIGKGKLRGYLYDAGDYPAAIADKRARSFIYGSIVDLKADEVLKIIDAYEGYGEEEPETWLFVRKLLTIETENGEIDCWAYLYNHPTENLKLIPSGDYLNYIK